MLFFVTSDLRVAEGGQSMSRGHAQSAPISIGRVEEVNGVALDRHLRIRAQAARLLAQLEAVGEITADRLRLHLLVSWSGR